MVSIDGWGVGVGSISWGGVGVGSIGWGGVSVSIGGSGVLLEQKPWLNRLSNVRSIQNSNLYNWSWCNHFGDNWRSMDLMEGRVAGGGWGHNFSYRGGIGHWGGVHVLQFQFEIN
jgi:hypothetical protein